MDSDEFDDDILDEDLIIAASQAPVLNQSAPSRIANSVLPHAQRARLRQTGNSFTPRQGRNRISHPDVIDLDELPSDAFSSSPGGGALSAQSVSRNARPTPKVGGPAPVYRQMTLFNTTAPPPQNGTAGSSQRPSNTRQFRVDLPEEKPTHHEIDNDAMKTWVYPTNLGAIRDYQYTIVKEGLFNNTLVALPTGLGKTFIAATIMLNYYRWTKKAKIVFVAPTKPLASQQVDACFNIAGIPRSQTTLLTGEVNKGLRAEEWESKRVFFMTPQTLQNDLSSGAADPKSIALLVVDEAHRATGNYAYVKVVEFIRRFSSSFRILALTATPGSNVEAVQEVIDSLGISRVEIRTEDSLDIRQYVHQRQEDIEILEPSEEMIFCREHFTKALKPLVDKLNQQNIYSARDPMTMTVFGLMKSRKDWAARVGPNVNQFVKFSIQAIFTVLQSLAHAIKLLNFHGIKPFYDNLVRFRDEVEDKGAKGPKYKRQVIDSPEFQDMMSKISTWNRKDDFVSHPKLTYLSDTILNHFMDAGEGRENGGTSNTRIIVFSEFRDSAEEIVRVLNRHKPMIRAAVFVGQADTKQSEGMKQSEQIERIKKFKEGSFNVLVATSIGEEGLDIGQVDLIVCYDASASPIRMLQRMGRTGRKRAGRVVLLLMQGKEEDNYAKSKDAYDKMQQMICDGSRFNFRHELSTRIVPRDIRPEVDKRHVDIPIENTQNQSLPEPKKRAVRKKAPPKKFHMPDGVETGFTSVASMLGKRSAPTTKAQPQQQRTPKTFELAAIPSEDSVLLTNKQAEELHRIYQNLPSSKDLVQVVASVDLTAKPLAQRSLHKTVLVQHGKHTERCVRLFRNMSNIKTSTEYNKMPPLSDESHYAEILVPSDISDSETESTSLAHPPKRQKTATTVGPKHKEVTSCSRSKPSNPNETMRSKSIHRNVFMGELSDSEREDLVEITPPPPQKRPAIKKAAPRKAPMKKPPPNRAPKRQSACVYDESADEGDDCRRTSDLDLTDDSDNGSDMEGFVVGDDVATSSAPPTSSMRRLSTSPTTPSASFMAGFVSARSRQGHGRSRQVASDSDEDDLPSMKQIASRHKSQTVAVSDTDGTDNDIVQRAARGPRRRVIVDDEDDSESA
ncbi:ATP-dependent DNA helicase MPH1 [Pestalotiopsis fici W106-1]|uniref:ATP-dependent DNA helicase n=1 Tax=Pestalotiopsis fici (strain W106-1 / CGMCC3.15140) TaxID=1229662 RepID=W3XQT9_PESFW|nr:ATP-dependent DNA helicase MPH1 [Pestalotiopsis fici W106-1]ETS87611.1 ATP-dependent DNA helicase MPH1 [Pestalotiopsis fici W106-1]